jgi:SnoaL-like domain
MTSIADDVTERTRSAATSMYAAVVSGDLETFMSFISASIVVEEPGFLPYGGAHEGIDGLQGLFGEFAQRFDLNGLEIETIVVDGNHVCAFAHVPTADGSGTVVFVERAIFEDDKAVHLRVYMHDAGNLLEGRCRGSHP